MRVALRTFGCKTNQYETQALSEQLRAAGADIVTGSADIYVVNTCSVTAAAEAKTREYIRRIKKQHPHAKIAACGCMATARKNELARCGADYIVEQSDKQNVPALLLGISKRYSTWDMSVHSFFRQRAFLKIQDGCDNACSFCIIPYLRGRSQSRPRAEIIQEMRRLSAHHREIVLTGVNLALWGRDLNPPEQFDDLIVELLNQPDLGRLRLSSLEPALVSEKLLNLFSHPKLCPHFHLPFQSGDDTVLRAMNKKETTDLYVSLVSHARKVNARIAITGDILIGFPAESDASFEKTRIFLSSIAPMRIHIFPFSPRAQTPYAHAAVNTEVIKKRLLILKEECARFTRAYLQHNAHTSLRMIAEEHKHEYTLGYTENYIRVRIKEKLTLGSEYEVILAGTQASNATISDARVVTASSTHVFSNQYPR